MMKLYSYSSQRLTVVDAKWTLAKFATGGVLIGIILLFGFLELNPSVGNAIGTRSAGSLAAENEILRQQIILIAPRVSNLELQAGQLRDRSEELRKFLDRSRLVRDSVAKIPKASPGVKFQSLVALSKRPRP
jgi:hypothetical protein